MNTPGIQACPGAEGGMSPAQVAQLRTKISDLTSLFDALIQRLEQVVALEAGRAVAGCPGNAGAWPDGARNLPRQAPAIRRAGAGGRPMAEQAPPQPVPTPSPAAAGTPIPSPAAPPQPRRPGRRHAPE
jgi:hypothetical protein